jgi:thiol-disulfide isomerase/thioredoxin
VSCCRPGKIEVVEFFWYECPHCNAFEPLLEAWAKKLPADVAFRRVPVGFTARHQVAQKLYYALERSASSRRCTARSSPPSTARASA